MKKKKAVNILLNMHPLQRVLVSLGLTLAALLGLQLSKIHLPDLVYYMLLWDVFALSYITTGWIVFFNRSVEQIRQWARVDDGSRFFVSFIILLASFSSLFTVLLLMLSPDTSHTPKLLYLPVAITSMLASWVMVHTTFCFHYANLYYDDDDQDSTRHAAGLEFPKEKRPDYLDFAYFSFVIGMTFQVSDVQIDSRVIRRTALLHGLISFALNTFVVALTINLIAGLKE
ncbi:DUF1345 domain-containing protein [Chitinophaga nivalis]|uniref:DUF1345 domain-containing protein n=1 Tax=Chitinophaga nivalis TaxID=2991709 RepID=A0ABT3IX00_9BACT|nr:DUF1345 domain-containing protein [Chitinophaga nivalis]MCW3461832.1 DUF1345 domain-containing protein [Chitinophaga nivalis]MCW3488474.1 DUF1345 domain-containing protein [Chitinophaga nivalis]